MIAHGAKLDLPCIPIAVKDNIMTIGTKPAAGSIALYKSNRVRSSSKDAMVVVRLKSAGCILVGKGNMDEFALGFTSLSSRGGQTRNAYSPLRYPGGSSGGVGVSVALGLAVIGVGTDTGGSVRIPAAFGNLFGIRPKMHTIPMDHDVVPLSHSRDVVGLMTRGARDLAMALQVSSDSNFMSCLKKKVHVKLGVLRFLFPTKDKSVMKVYTRALSKLSHMNVLNVESAPNLQSKLNELFHFKSTSSFEFEDDMTRFFEQNISLNEILSLTKTHCKLSESECEGIIQSIRKKKNLDPLQSNP